MLVSGTTVKLSSLSALAAIPSLSVNDTRDKSLMKSLQVWGPVQVP